MILAMPSLGRGALEVLVVLAAAALTFLCGAVLFLLHGHNPLEVYAVFFNDVLFSGGALSQVAFKATTLSFTGLSAAFAFRAGLFNVGAEGQLYLGAFLGAALAIFLPLGLPAAAAVPLVLAASALGGALAASIPAILKATRGTHEVIQTMMMNFIVIALVNWLLGDLRESAEVVRTRAVPDAWRLMRFVRGFDGNAAALLGLAAALAVFVLFARTRLGFELKVLGQNVSAAENAGIQVPSRLVLALTLSGALAGLGGVNFVLGSPGYFEQHFAPGQGFLGLAVALLARNHPLGVVLAALLFAVIGEGAQAIQAFVPKELGTILEALVVIWVVVGARLLASAREAAEKSAEVQRG